MKELEIRPTELFKTYLELSRKDSQALNREDFITVPCPGCAAPPPPTRKFSADGFDFVQCHRCGTLFCSPRPPQAALDRFYENSESARYWSTVFLPAVAEVRREKIFRKRAAQIHAALTERNIYPEKVCDVGAGYGIFLEELRKYFPNSSFYAIEPGGDAARLCRTKGFQTLPCPAEEARDWHGKFDLVICSEVIEHVFSTGAFIEAIYQLLRQDGRCLVTGLGYEGFDILTLQEESNSISAPHHLNFLSIQGFETLFRAQRFRTVEVTTPGELDLDIVHNRRPEDEFIRVLYSRGEKAVREFQGLLQKYRLSSHVWIWGEK